MHEYGQKYIVNQFHMSCNIAAEYLHLSFSLTLNLTVGHIQMQYETLWATAQYKNHDNGIFLSLSSLRLLCFSSSFFIFT